MLTEINLFFISVKDCLSDTVMTFLGCFAL